MLVGTEYIGESKGKASRIFVWRCLISGNPQFDFHDVVQVDGEVNEGVHCSMPFQVHFYTLAISAGEWTLLAIRSLSSWTEEAAQPLSPQENQTCIGIVL